MCGHIGDERSKEVSRLRDELTQRVELLNFAHWHGSDADDSGLLDPFELGDLLERCGDIFGRKLSSSESNLLCHLGDWRHGQLETAEVVALLVCGCVYVRQAAAWRAHLGESVHDGKGVWQLMQLLRSLNGGNKVQYKEVEWLIEMASVSTTKQSETTTALLMAIAFWYTTPQAETARGLHREMLIARLRMELAFEHGVVRLLTLVVLGMLLSWSCVISVKSDLCRGIRDNLATVYEFEALADVRSTSDVLEALRRFDAASARFSPLSPEYLKDSAEWLLQEETKHFAGPEQLPQVDVWVGTGFSLQAWVSLDPRAGLPTGGLPILRRPLLATGASCWSWTFPPGLAYGAQDFGGAAANRHTEEREEFVEGNYSGYLAARTPVDGSSAAALPESSGLVLHTLVVNSTHVHFMEGPGNTVLHAALKRPVTDCDGRLQIGSRGLGLTAVRFFPEVLSPQDVSEVFTGGSSMAHIGYNIRGRVLEPQTDVAELTDAIAGREAHLSDQAAASARGREILASLTASAVMEPSSSPVALSMVDLPVQRAPDGVFPEDSWSFVNAPIYTDSGSAILSDGRAIPILTGAGLALSVWVKPTGAPGYLFGRAMASSFSATGEPIWSGWTDFCNYGWVGTNGRIYMKSGDRHAARSKVIEVEVSTGSEVPDEWRLRGTAYRHLVFRIDPANSTRYLSICVDGTCWGRHHTYKDSKGSPPVDCEALPRWDSSTANQTKFFIARRPPNDLHYTGYIANMRLFNRTLSDAEVARLFLEDPDPEDPAGRPIRSLRGCKKPQENLDAVAARDDFGHGCLWYFRARQAGARVCGRSSWARRHCPVACGLVEICWGSAAPTGMSLQIWERQVDIYPVGRGGVTCVGKSTSAEQVAVTCGLSAIPPRDCSAFLGNRAELSECLGNASWEVQYGLDCRAIVELHDPYCDWDDSLLDQLGAAANETGEWALQFWFESLEAACPDPRIRLMDGRGALLLWVAPFIAGGSPWDDTCGGTHTGAVRTSLGLSGADSRRSTSRNAVVYTDAALPGERHLLTVGVKDAGRTVSPSIEGFVGLVGMQYDLQSNFDITGMEPILHGQHALRVINVVAPVRLSPLLLTTRFPLEGDVAIKRYSQLDIQGSKIGPSRPLREQMTTQLQRGTARFSQKSVLVSPPLVIQERARPDTCGSDFSNTVVRLFADLARKFGCTSPYSCVSREDSDVYQCPGPREDGEFFGMMPVIFNDQLVHVEYLATIAAHKFLVRQVNGRQALTTTDDFVDTLTRQVSLKALFYSVEFGITTELTMSFDTSGGRVHAESNLAHYVVLAGDALQNFRVLHYLIMFLLAGFTLHSIMAMRRALVNGLRTSSGILFNLAWECLLVFTLLTYQIAVLTERGGSEGTTSKYISDIIKIPWDAGTLSFLEKRTAYLRSFEAMHTVQSDGARLESLGMAVGIFLLLTIVLDAGAHPRIAVLTSTFRQAFNNLMHFGFIFSLVFCGLAQIASWRFGSYREDLATLWAACKTQFNALLDPPGALGFPEDGSVNPEYLVYAVLYHGLCFFFLMNFVLAIIINAYAKTEERTQSSGVVQSILQDLVDVPRTAILKFRFRWPSRHKIVKRLQGKVSSRLVGAEDLMPVGFRSEADAQAFCSFYGRFACMPGVLRPEAEEAEPLVLAAQELRRAAVGMARGDPRARWRSESSQARWRSESSQVSGRG